MILPHYFVKSTHQFGGTWGVSEHSLKEAIENANLGLLDNQFTDTLEMLEEQFYMPDDDSTTITYNAEVDKILAMSDGYELEDSERYADFELFMSNPEVSKFVGVNEMSGYPEYEGELAERRMVCTIDRLNGTIKIKKQEKR